MNQFGNYIMKLPYYMNEIVIYIYIYITAKYINVNRQINHVDK